MPEMSPLQPQAKRTSPLVRRLVPRSRPILRGLSVAVAVALAGAALSMAWRESADYPSAAAALAPATSLALGPRDVDSLATAYAKRLVLELQELSSSGEGQVRELYEAGVLRVQSLRPDAPSPSGLSPIERQRVERVVDALDRADRRRLMRDELHLYEMTLRDSEAEDGDLVSYDVDGRVMGYAQLAHSTRHVSVPIARGRPTEIGVTGVFDGGGGITLGVVTRNGETFVGNIAPLQRVTFRLTAP